MKTILIAVPTNKYIEPTTFKAIYDLEVPEGYRTEFQYFYGYQVDQIRNLISHWAIHYDYLFSVDSDIAFPKDTLKKLLKHDVDMVSGLYIQRKENEHTLEIYEANAVGGNSNIPYDKIKHLTFLEIAACGMGCVLIKSKVLKDVGYPQFVYHSAIDHRHTVSEDVDFCRKAKAKGFKIYADVTVQCSHTGSKTFFVDSNPRPIKEPVEQKTAINYIAEEDRLPVNHQNYIKTLNIEPKIIYDIGACVMHWTRHAEKRWPNSKYFLFEAENGVEKVLSKSKHSYHLGLLTDKDNKQIKFYHDINNAPGNSYYKEVTGAFTEQHAEMKIGMTLDTIVKQKNYPLPDLIKLDVQGAELDILKGAKECIKNCSDIILEAQHKTYNEGAPNVDEVIKYMESLGFGLVSNFNKEEYDGDYHFKKNSKGMKPTKAYILTIKNPLSVEYARGCAKSCDTIGLEWESFEGYENMTKEEVWKKFDYKVSSQSWNDWTDACACCTASHFNIWKKIVENKECAIILEHDAIMLHKVNIEIPHDKIVSLGYKLRNPNRYDSQTVGEPKKIVDIENLYGGHAYAITYKTAEKLLNELKEKGVVHDLDNYYFSRENKDSGHSDVPLAITDPIAALGWVRKSTIWGNAFPFNLKTIDSFNKNLKD
jgi:FkbM family methyltransferase